MVLLAQALKKRILNFERLGCERFEEGELKMIILIIFGGSGILGIRFYQAEAASGRSVYNSQIPAGNLWKGSPLFVLIR